MLSKRLTIMWPYSFLCVSGLTLANCVNPVAKSFKRSAASLSFRRFNSTSWRTSLKHFPSDSNKRGCAVLNVYCLTMEILWDRLYKHHLLGGGDCKNRSAGFDTGYPRKFTDFQRASRFLLQEMVNKVFRNKDLLSNYTDRQILVVHVCSEHDAGLLLNKSRLHVRCLDSIGTVYRQLKVKHRTHHACHVTLLPHA